MCYYNENSTNYAGEIDWNMYISSEGIAYPKNGTSIIPITYKVPEGLLNAQTTETAEPEHVESEPNNNENNTNNADNTADDNDNSSRVTSVNQGAQSELIEENAPAKLATMFISIMNNTSNSYANFQILGRLPFAGNKDILTDIYII